MPYRGLPMDNGGRKSRDFVPSASFNDDDDDYAYDDDMSRVCDKMYCSRDVFQVTNQRNQLWL